MSELENSDPEELNIENDDSKLNLNKKRNRPRSSNFKSNDCPIYKLFLAEGKLIVRSKEVDFYTKTLIIKGKVTVLKTVENLFDKGRNISAEMLIEHPDKLHSYLVQRYYLFSRFDSGIKLDEESKLKIYHFNK